MPEFFRRKKNTNVKQKVKEITCFSSSTQKETFGLLIVILVLIKVLLTFLAKGEKRVL